MISYIEILQRFQSALNPKNISSISNVPKNCKSPFIIHSIYWIIPRKTTILAIIFGKKGIFPAKF